MIRVDIERLATLCGEVEDAVVRFDEEACLRCRRDPSVMALYDAAEALWAFLVEDEVPN